MNLQHFFYQELIDTNYYSNYIDLHKKLKLTIFINFDYKVNNLDLPLNLILLYFFIFFNTGFYPQLIKLKKKVKRFSYNKDYPLGLKLFIRKFIYIAKFLYIFNYWTYYLVFGDLKEVKIDKKGKFFLIKFPLINFFPLLNFNIVTNFLFYVKFPKLKYVISIGNSNLSEFNTITNFFSCY